jgi:hypothetical protein
MGVEMVLRAGSVGWKDIIVKNSLIIRRQRAAHFVGAGRDIGDRRPLPRFSNLQ